MDRVVSDLKEVGLLTYFGQGPHLGCEAAEVSYLSVAEFQIYRARVRWDTHMKPASLVVSLKNVKLLRPVLTGDNSKPHLVHPLCDRPIPRSENSPFLKMCVLSDPHFTDEHLMPQPWEGIKLVQTWII